MPSHVPFCPVDIRIVGRAEGEAAVRAMLPPATARRLLVLAPRALCTELSLASFFTALQFDGHSVHLVTEIPANPSVQDVADLLEALRQQEFDPEAILAIGGGSCMDLAKALSAFWRLPPSLSRSGDSVREGIHEKAYLAKGHSLVPLVTMPTTSGTGSEVTHWATIWDSQNQQKLSIDCPELFPLGAVLIPEWTAGMPAALTLSTGLDALSHAMEAFWANASTPLSRALSIAAVQKIRCFLPQVLSKPQDIVLRQEMCVASLLAGLAFSGTRTTACHSLSYPLTMLHGIPHGFAAALTLLPVLRRNKAVLPEIQQLEDIFAEEGGLSAWLQRVCDGVQVLRLSAFGVTEDQLAAISALAFTTGRMDNNPIPFTPEESIEILQESM